MYHRIKYFLKAAETGSFSIAAREMFISPPALTKQINILEEELGGKLFVRTPQGVTLTRMGKLAFQKLSAISRATDDAVESLRAFAMHDKIPFKIGFFSGLPIDDLVSPVVSFLMTFYPQYQFSFEMLELEEGNRKLNDGKLDMLFTQIPEEEEQDGYQYLSFGEQEARVIVSLTHPWVLKEEISVEDLQKEPFFCFSEETEEEDLHGLQVPCKNIITVSNYKTTLMLLRQGEGFALFPIDAHGVAKDHLKTFDYPGKALLYNTALIYRRDNTLDGLENIVNDLKAEFDLVPC